MFFTNLWKAGRGVVIYSYIVKSSRKAEKKYDVVKVLVIVIFFWI